MYDPMRSGQHEPDTPFSKLVKEIQDIKALIGAESDSSTSDPGHVPALDPFAPLHQKRPKTLLERIQDIDEKVSRFEKQITNIDNTLTQQSYPSNQQVETISQEIKVVKKEISASNQQVKAIAEQVKALDNSVAGVKGYISSIEYQLTQTLEQHLDVISKQIDAQETAWKQRDESIHTALEKYVENIQDRVSKAVKNFEQAIQSLREGPQLATERVFNVLRFAKSLNIETKLPVKETNKAKDLKSLTADLVKGMNRIQLLLDKAIIDHENEAKYYHEAAKLACKMLQETLGNQHYREGIRNLAKAQEQNTQEFTEIMTFDKRFEAFLEEERKLLKSAGVHIADDLIADYHKIREMALRGEARDWDMYQSIGRLQGVMCNLEKDLERRIPQTQNRERNREIIEGATTAIAGVVVVGTNASATSLDPAMQAVSGALGGFMIEMGAGKVLRK
ncbi:MAG: hypothetical protein KJ077_27435 [Anaerolineae bacterium]|nr:hypothetical protein [Anaerolineae bacterium]